MEAVPEWQIQGKEAYRVDKEMETDRELIQDGEQLAAFSAETFPMTVEEADVLLGYVGGHGYALAGKDGRLYCGDVCGQPEEISWEEYDIEDIIDDASEWNFDMMQDSERLMGELESYDDYQLVSEGYEALRGDEKILDSLFDRTKYGKIIENMASGIAEGIIRGLSAGNSIDSAVRSMNIKEAAAGIRGDSEKAGMTENKKGRCR